MPPEAGSWVQLITTGGFGAIVWYLIAVHIPRERKAFTDELSLIRAERATERLDVQNRIAELTASYSLERRAFLEELGKFREILWKIHGELERKT